MQTYDVIILGGGPAGLTSAIYTSRAKLNVLVIAGNPPGGQLMWTTEVENFPGFVDGIMGPDLVSNMRLQAEKFGTTCVDENVLNVSGDASSGFRLNTDSSNSYFGKCLIIATGASAKWLNLPSEQRLRGKGVSACATCDGFFFKNKKVAVVGGGDASMEEAIYLTKFADSVTVLVRGTRDSMKASKIMQEEAFSNSKIAFLFNSEVKEVLGTDSVSGITVSNNADNTESHLDVQGLFIAIGHNPNTEFLSNLVDLEPNGYIKVFNGTRTSLTGVFVAGDVGDYKYRQAISAAGMGCMAALDAEKFLRELPKS